MEPLVELQDNIMYYLVDSLFMLFILNPKLFRNVEVKPHSFAKTALKSEPVMTEIISQTNTLLPQLAQFIGQFSATTIEYKIVVVTDPIGNMDIDVPKDMSDELANKVSKKIGIIDRLITTHGQSINDLLQKGVDIEKKLKLENSNYVSQLTEKVEEFKKLNSSYKH
jgi:hypothetical protein